MTTEISIRPDQVGFDETQKAALESLGIADAPAGDQQLFMHVAQRSGLDPFAKQIYLIPRWDTKSNRNKWTIQTSIDGLRVIRDRIGKFEGLVTEWCGPDGVWRDVWLSKNKPAAARVSVYVKGFQVPVRGIALWEEYAQTTKNGGLTAMWNGKSTVMIAKCAEAIAYRQAFPQDFSGLYVAEEMPQAAVEQDHDGPNVVTTMRETRTQAPKVHNGTAEAHLRSSGGSEPAADATPTAPKRPGRPRAESQPGPTPTPEVDEQAIADEWAVKTARAITLTAWRDLWKEAKRRGFHPYATTGGEILEHVMRDRGETLANEEAQAQAGEPDADQGYAGPEGDLDGEPLY